MFFELLDLTSITAVKFKNVPTNNHEMSGTIFVTKDNNKQEISRMRSHTNLEPEQSGVSIQFQF